MTGKALERHDAHPGAGIALVPGEREMAGIEFNARAIAALDSRLKGKPDAKEMAFGLAVTLWNYGLPGTVVNAKKLHLIPAGKDKVDVFESAQLLLGLLTLHGHDVWFVEETEQRVVVRGRRFGEGRVHEVVYDIDRARKSGALDGWVERKYRNPGDNYDRTEKWTVAVDGVMLPGPFPDWVPKQLEQGRILYNDYWRKHLVDAMGNRAIRRMAKRLGADALLGISAPDPTDRIEPRPDDIVLDDEFGEPLDDPTEPTETAHGTLAEDAATGEVDQDAAHRNECSRVHAASARIPDGTWRQLWAKAWREAGLPAKALDLTPDQLEPARLITRQYIALASLDSIGLSGTAARHAFVTSATGGETESTKALTAEQLQAVLRAVADERHRLEEERRLAEEAAAMEAEQRGQQEPEYAPGEEPF